MATTMNGVEIYYEIHTRRNKWIPRPIKPLNNPSMTSSTNPSCPLSPLTSQQSSLRPFYQGIVGNFPEGGYAKVSLDPMGGTTSVDHEVNLSLTQISCQKPARDQ